MKPSQAIKNMPPWRRYFVSAEDGRTYVVVLHPSGKAWTVSLQSAKGFGRVCIWNDNPVVPDEIARIVATARALQRAEGRFEGEAP